MKEIIETLVQEVGMEELRREQRRRRDEQSRREAERQEELDRRIHDSFVRAQEDAEKRILLAKKEKVDEYIGYYQKYHDLKRTADEIGEQFYKQGTPCLQVLEFKDKYMRMCMKDWPEPYKSKCDYTEIERTFYRLNPYQASLWVNILSTNSK